ncbi:MAG: glycosyltransferase family 4 protein, partial [Planctomycetes bacterium]|nr:glycosyltransferase family 4 protein [Planctomycetota bacterium]
EIEAKSGVLHVGCELSECDAIPATTSGGPAVILWNHRWEHDKAPQTFFEVLFELADAGADFRLVVVGEHFRQHPPIFDVARERLSGRIVQFGHLPDRRGYLDMLKKSDIVVSTARHEFFGIAVVEAIACGCYPLLPNRLSYPEIIPPELHGRHLYSGRRELKDRLGRLIADPESARAVNLRPQMARFSWESIAPQFDAALERASRR